MENALKTYLMTKGSLVLCGHPLSENFKKAVEAKIGQPARYISLSSIKAKGAVGALRYLFGLKVDCIFVAFEEPEEVIFKPIICLLSLIIWAPQRYLIGPNLEPSQLTAGDMLSFIGNVAIGSLVALKNGFVAFVELANLKKSGACTADAPRNSKIVYLNTNVMFGVKAGGSLGHIAGVVNDLYRRKVDILYVATKRSSVIDAAVPMQKLLIPSLLGLPTELFLFGLSQQAYKQCRKLFGADRTPIIYQRMSRCNYSGARLSHKYNAPLIMEYNGSEAWGARHWGHPMLFERLARSAELVSLRAAHMVVTISDVLADELVAIGIRRSKIVVYPNCVDSTVFDSARFSPGDLEMLRSRQDIPTEAIVLGFIGTFGKWHGIDILCEAIRTLAHHERDWLDRFNVRFLFVGDGHLRSFVEDLVGDQVATKYVIWPGMVEQTEAPSYLAMMDILVSPHVPNADGSRFFGSPTKLFEYMSMARPIIASRLEQIQEVLSPSLSASKLPVDVPIDRTNELAILSEPGNVGELIRAIRFLVERQDWRDVLAKNARIEVLKKYQWSHHVSKILAGIDAISIAENDVAV